jgi:hypothetical protein
MHKRFPMENTYYSQHDENMKSLERAISNTTFHLFYMKDKITLQKKQATSGVPSKRSFAFLINSHVLSTVNKKSGHY